MAKSLVVVESPTKVKTIKKFLGGDYDVVASMGHIKDLPKSTLGIDLENNFEPTYSAIEAKKKTIDDLKKYFNPQVETMEGAAFYYCCFSAGVNCAEIRTISNFIETRSLAKWEIEKAVDALAEKVIAILNAFKCC